MSTMLSLPASGFEGESSPVGPVLLDSLYEVLNGRIVEKPALGVYETHVASILMCLLSHFVRTHSLGHLESEMLFLLDVPGNLKLRPDLAFVSHDRWEKCRPVPRTAEWNVIPTLAIEVVSPSNSAISVLEKVVDYFRCGSQEVWVIYPLQEQVYVYHSPTSIRVLTRADRLESPEIFPGFQLPLEDLFETESPSE